MFDDSDVVGMNFAFVAPTCHQHQRGRIYGQMRDPLIREKISKHPPRKSQILSLITYDSGSEGENKKYIKKYDNVGTINIKACFIFDGICL